MYVRKNLLYFIVIIFLAFLSIYVLWNMSKNSAYLFAIAIPIIIFLGSYVGMYFYKKGHLPENAEVVLLVVSLTFLITVIAMYFFPSFFFNTIVSTFFFILYQIILVTIIILILKIISNKKK